MIAGGIVAAFLGVRAEGPRDRHVHDGIGQIVRALQAQGPQGPDQLAGVLGAGYWEAGRFDKALALAVSDGLLTRQGDGRLATT